MLAAFQIPALPVDFTTLLLLCCFAFLAGFIDSIAGGGGLIQLPALLILLPQFPVPTLLGTGKVSGFMGTSVAAVQYGRKVTLPWRALVPASLTALAFSFLGARVVTLVNSELLKPAILVLLVAVAIYTALKKDFGSLHAPRLRPLQQQLASLLTGAVLGFYDGFFGPGTGSFLIFLFIGLFGYNFLTAAASAKVVNVATNLAALLYFAWGGHILYAIGLPMAACNIAGSVIGSRLAILKGSSFIRVLFLAVVLGVIARYGWEVFGV